MFFWRRLKPCAGLLAGIFVAILFYAGFTSLYKTPLGAFPAGNTASLKIPGQNAARSPVVWHASAGTDRNFKPGIYELYRTKSARSGTSPEILPGTASPETASPGTASGTT